MKHVTCKLPFLQYDQTNMMLGDSMQAPINGFRFSCVMSRTCN